VSYAPSTSLNRAAWVARLRLPRGFLNPKCEDLTGPPHRGGPACARLVWFTPNSLNAFPFACAPCPLYLKNTGIAERLIRRAAGGIRWQMCDLVRFWSAHAEPLVTRFTLAVLVVGSEFRNPCPCGAWRAGAAPEGFDCAVLRTSARAPMSVNVSHWRRFLRSHDPDQMRTLPHQGSLSGHAHTFPTTPRRCRGRGGSVLETGRKTQRCQTMKRACAVAPSWDCHRREPILAQ